MRTVAALYVDPKGPYPSMPDVEAWDEKRDAMLYAGPHPVVAHPPCGPWSKLKGFCTRQNADCGPRAIEQAREFGGIVEHPAFSSLWRHMALPAPGAPSDRFGGETVYVEQADWGHLCRKPTWLYCVRVDRAVSPGKAPPSKRVEQVWSTQRHLSPQAFADYLVSLARLAG